MPALLSSPRRSPAPAPMRTQPFYSVQRGPDLVDIWHDNDACPLAQQIAPSHRRRGIGYLRQLCPHCQALNGPVHWYNWLRSS